MFTHPIGKLIPVCNGCMITPDGKLPPTPFDPSNKLIELPAPDTLVDAELEHVYIPLDNIATLEVAERVLIRRSLLAMVKRFHRKYLAGWVHEDICRRLERFMRDVEAGLSPRLLLCMPPRHGKSTLTSNFFPAWVLGHNPEWEIIAASHTQSLALKFSGFIRDLLRDPAYTAIFSDAVLNPESQSKEAWDTTVGGGYLAAGVGTGITGRGAHILIIDDPVKDMEQADSATIRDSIWEWYTSTAYTRLAPGGGVLGIMCMTGDTPVLMADGTQRRLDTLKASEEVATFDRGVLTTATIKGLRSSGRDSVLKITTTSGRLVRANQRHPFLTVTPDGELTWTRARGLTTAHKIVTVKGSGVSGEALLAPKMDATCRPSVEGIASRITPKNAGLTDTVAQQTEPGHAATLASSTATGSHRRTTTPSTHSSGGVAPSVESTQAVEVHQLTGRTSSLLTTATTLARCEGYSATCVTEESDILQLSPWHLPRPGISDFTLDEIVSIEPDGVEEVFDLSVERTENFIAGGLVSHNTLWNEDDWGGRIIEISDSGEGDKFEIVRYPAINEGYAEYLDENQRDIIHVRPLDAIPEGATLLRPPNTALHPARYDLVRLQAMKKNYYARGNQRTWSALYQQRPTPEDGIYFTKALFRYYSSPPARRYCTVYQAWDFAITETQESDWTVCATILQDSNDCLYLLDIDRFRSDDSIEIVDRMLDNVELWGADLVGMEDGQIWKTMQAQWEKRCLERKLYPAHEILKPLTDKKVRAMPLRGRMQLGKVYFPLDAPWKKECEDELLKFPGGKHDDQVDAIAWGVRLTLTKSAPRIPEPPPVKSWRDKLKVIDTTDSGHMAA